MKFFCTKKNAATGLLNYRALKWFSVLNCVNLTYLVDNLSGILCRVYLIFLRFSEIRPLITYLQFPVMLGYYVCKLFSTRNHFNLHNSDKSILFKIARTVGLKGLNIR